MRLRPWRLLAMAGAALALTSNAWAIVEAGKAAPAWKAKTMAGAAIGSAELKGKVVVVNFFSYG
jgi:hypothetical protein